MRRAFFSWITLVAVLLFFAPKMALSEEAHLFLCGIDMRIGMPKQEILNKLRQNYKLGKYPEEDNWRIVQKTGSHWEILGKVNFRNEKLSWASKMWGEGISTATEFGSALFTILSNLEREGYQVPSVITGAVRQPGVDIEVIKFDFGEKLLTILVSHRGSHGDSVTIQETLQSQ
jgi:hypothetical protein